MSISLYWFVVVTLAANWWLFASTLFDTERPPFQKNIILGLQLLYCVWGTTALWSS